MSLSVIWEKTLKGECHIGDVGMLGRIILQRGLKMELDYAVFIEVCQGRLQ
jgi:hypothetical protein